MKFSEPPEFAAHEAAMCRSPSKALVDVPIRNFNKMAVCCYLVLARGSNESMILLVRFVIVVLKDRHIVHRSKNSRSKIEVERRTDSFLLPS